MTSITSPARLVQISVFCLASALAGAFAMHLSTRLRQESTASRKPKTSSTASTVGVTTAHQNADGEHRSLSSRATGGAVRPEVVIERIVSIWREAGTNTLSVIKLAGWVNAATDEELRIALTIGEEGLPSRGHLRFLQQCVAARLGAIDGEVAQALMNARPGGHELFGSAKEELFQAWFATDPRAAMEGAMAQLGLEGTKFGTILHDLIVSAADKFPFLAQSAAAKLANSGDGEIRQLGFDTYAKLLTQNVAGDKDFPKALSWIENAAVSAEQRERLRLELIQYGLRNDHIDGAIETFRGMDGTKHSDLAAMLAGSLAEKSPEQAKFLAASFPAGEARAKATDAVAFAFVQAKQPSQALAWLSAQGSGADFDRSFARIANALSESDPEAAVRSVAMMTDTAVEKSALSHNLGFNWLNADFATASRQLPERIVDRFKLASSLVRELAGLVPEFSANHDLNLTWSPRK